MNKTSLAWATCLVFSLVSGLPVQAQTAYAPPPAPVYTQQQLDQMLAPVALYPDSLLAQVLMASTYPLEVVQAARFVDSRPGLQGDALALSIAPMPWDPSVKALVQFPSVLAMMNDKLDWTQRLGDAFLSQQANVMDTVQNLRVKAQIAGNLQSSNQQRIVQQEQIIVIEPVNPQVIYVPYYNPTVVYGSWWWPQRPPVYWAPPPRYRPPSYNVSIGISFGAGTGIVRSVYSDARPDWRQRQVMVTQTRINNVTNVTNVNNVNNTNVINNRYVNNNINVNRNVSMNQRPVVWHHDPRYAGGRYAQQPAPALAPPPGQRPLAGPQAQNLVQAQHVPQWNGHGPQPQAGQPFPANTPRPLPVADNVQQRLAQQDQFRQRQAIDQQRQREQQANDQQRQREQMIRDQQHQRDQQAQEQRQQQQAQERQWQQRQQQVQQQQQRQQQMQQQQLQQQQREQQMRQHQQQEQQRQQQMMNQQREQQHRQMEQARQQQQQHQAAQHEQQARQQQAQQRDAHQRREDRRDERS
ncbi:DUF3300 domain-containing protein [Herbaspirillum huttiense]|uniref:DUF3300 domain-containing protein n=1 Tax=Herbaspirillum huttiense TaxID=863372 RepID=UPI000400F53B|nr:DUF3300 domain-containing protein [Herbaspirillum huttiense]